MPPQYSLSLPLRLLAIGSLLLTCQSTRADVKMPGIFGDHMVLQQDASLPVWGTAAPGEKVTVSVGGQTQSATAGADGKWQVKLKPFPVGGAPLQMTVAGKNTLKFEDVLVGEVWLCSGQSNMAFPMSSTYDAKTDLPQANDPQLRLFKVAQKMALEPQTDVAGGKWELCSPETAKGFSAVGYFFGRELRQNLKRPVGLIGSHVGGTPAQSWTSLSSLQKEPIFSNFVDAFQKTLKDCPAAKEAYPKLMEAYAAERKKWDDEVGIPFFNTTYKQWKEEADKARAAGSSVPPEPTPGKPRPIQPANPEGSGFTPSALFNGMIAPLVPYAMKGAIWYQGESGPAHYEKMLPLMIQDWRGKWGNDFSFLIVQLPNYQKPQKNPSEGGWALVRDAQLKALSLPNTGMAVAIDLADANSMNLHPGNKTEVGRRMGLAAEHVAYGQKIVYSGPIYDGMKVEGGKVRITFKNIGSGLTLGTPPPGTGLAKLPPPTELTGFAIAGEDKKWAWAKAKIDGATVVVWSDEVPKPVAVRYGWAGNPPCNLYNKEALPASPFRTDDWAQ